jgi:glucose/arabinose dehydrogenase
MPSMRRILAFFGLLLLVLGCGGSSSTGGNALHVQTIVPNADFPTCIRFAPDGRLFYTEKNSGNIRIVVDGTLLPQPFATVSVGNDGEQGLLGMAFDPDFANNHYLYIFYSESGVSAQRIARFTASANTGTNFTVLVDNLPRGFNHNSGRLAFGLDGKLYATQGETGDASNAQTTANLAGKVLRLNPDGTVPSDNPIPGSPIFSYGHRNCFGLAIYPGTGTPYVSENGPNCDDEVNRIVANGNYGWRPGQPCGDNDPNYIQPVRRYPTIIAPTGINFYNGVLFPEMNGDMLMTSFVEGTLRRLTINDSAGIVLSESVLINGLGGPTDVTPGPDGAIYIATQTSILRVTP